MAQSGSDPSTDNSLPSAAEAPKVTFVSDGKGLENKAFDEQTSG